VLGAFERQGLSWEEGVQLLKDVQDLREESERAKKEVAKHTMTRLHLEKERKQAGSTLRQLKTQLSNLRQIITIEEKRFKTLIGKILARQESLRRLTDAVEEKERTLRDSAKEYEDTIHKQNEQKAALQAGIQGLMKEAEEQKAVSQAEIRDLMKKTTRLKSTIKVLSEKVNILDALKSKIVQEAEEHAESIVASSEQEKTRNLKRVEELRKEIEILEAEKAFAESVVRSIIKGLREERKMLEETKVANKESLSFPNNYAFPKSNR
jgi:chromosome segregation ATPase